MKLELRILSGMHRGASLPMEPGVSLTLGCDATCDVVLVDEGIEPLAAEVQAQHDGWTVTPKGAENGGTDGQPSPQARLLHLGVAHELAGVRFCVCDAEDPWSFERSDLGESAADSEPAAAPPPPPPVEAALEPQAQHPKPRRRFGSVSKAWLLIVPVACTLALANFQAASTARQVSGWIAPGEAAAPALPQQTTVRAMSAAPPASAASAPKPMAELQRLFMARLRAADLAPLLEIELGDAKWHLRGSLSPEEDRRLESVIAAFFKEHRPPVAFTALVVPPEALLPFRISQISAGQMANVVTADGKRMFVGDSHAGYTLARVEPHKLVFTGKRRVEVAW